MRKPRRPDGTAADYSHRALKLVRTGGLTLTKRGWRFGTTRVSHEVVDRLVAEGKAVVRNDRCIPLPPEMQ